MPKRSAFKHYDLNQSKRYQLDVKSFLGVDYSTQKFLISDGHAIDLKNYIYKNGLVQKRTGHEEILLVKSIYYIPCDFDDPTDPLVEEIHNNMENPLDKRINGMWAFKAEDGQVHVVAHIGKLLYEVKNIDNEQITAEPFVMGEVTVDGEDNDLMFEFENYQSFAFVGGNKLWFLGGNKFMCLRFLDDGYRTRFSLFAVEDSDHTPIPTTTMSITYKNAITSGRQSLDNVNLLTEWRKNKFISGVGKNEDEKTKTVFYEYTLDAPLIMKKQSDSADIVLTIEKQGRIE